MEAAKGAVVAAVVVMAVGAKAGRAAEAVVAEAEAAEAEAAEAGGRAVPGGGSLPPRSCRGGNSSIKAGTARSLSGVRLTLRNTEPTRRC